MVNNSAKTEREELLDALVDAHGDLDLLLATIFMLDNKAMPSQSPVWPNMVKRHDLLKRYGRFE
jgi:hypothetical protein